MKYQVRSEGGELTVSSYGELRKLYARGFVTDDDEVRREGTDRWVKAGQIPDLRTVRPNRWQGSELLLILIAIVVLGLLLTFIFR